MEDRADRWSWLNRSKRPTAANQGTVVIAAHAAIQLWTYATMKAPCMYLLANRYRGTLYVGVTSDLAQRVSQHRLGLVEGFTRKYGVKSLVWYEPQETMEAAI